MIRALLAALLLAVAGCATAPIPYQDQATQIVWTQVYHHTDGPPRIQWKGGSELDCFPDPVTGVFRGFHGVKWYDGPATAECEGGLSWSDLWLSQIALYPAEPDFVFSGSSFAHELNHQRLYKETGDGDGLHTGPSWLPGGLVDQANQALKAVGL